MGLQSTDIPSQIRLENECSSWDSVCSFLSWKQIVNSWDHLSSSVTICIMLHHFDWENHCHKERQRVIHRMVRQVTNKKSLCVSKQPT